jgi:hypothetical protein
MDRYGRKQMGREFKICGGENLEKKEATPSVPF